MSRLIKALLFGLAACGALAIVIAPAVSAADSAPVGAWRTTNQCFLATFVLADGGRAMAQYLSGERDDNAAWNWDGTSLTITSATFPLDRFAGYVRNGHVEADYIWHDLDQDQLHRQNCIFERYSPGI